MRFSIITVTRNHLAGLEATARSLNDQRFRDFEWIVIDGASTDGTIDFLKRHPHTDWISEPDGGIYDAMNKGIDRAGGDYLLFLNAGDVLAGANVLERVAQALNGALNGADIVYGDSIESGHAKPARFHTRALWGMFTHHQAIFYRRAALNGVRYDTGLRIAADYKLTLTLLCGGKSGLYVPVAVCVFEPGGLSQRQARAGRVEQWRIRRDLRACGELQNAMIFAAQTALMTLRRACPGLYWFLKRAR